jgi:precorrin-6B methylase 2
MLDPCATDWTAEAILELGRGYQGAAVLGAAADLNLFGPLAQRPRTAADLARALACDPRGLAVLTDALAALGILRKSGDLLSLAPGLDTLLVSHNRPSVLAMVQHQAACLRKWAQLSHVVKTGKQAEAMPGARGAAGDNESFILAMDNVSAPVADAVIAAVRPQAFTTLLDVGGASGTWTLAFLRANPGARAILFDLPVAIPHARRRFEAAGVAARVELVAGDFYTDMLPAGADLAWVSAIVHQNSRGQNRALFAKVSQSLKPGGRIAIRDILMEPDRVHPAAGALFAINMLVATERGGTFTFEELGEDLRTAGFTDPAVARKDDGMNAIVIARKPV